MLFSAYVLKHQDSFKGAQDLKDRFIQDILTKTAPPLISFSQFVNFKALVKAEKDGSIVIESQKLHDQSWSSREKSNKMMVKLGYPLFQMFDIDHKNKTEIKSKVGLLEEEIKKIEMGIQDANCSLRQDFWGAIGRQKKDELKLKKDALNIELGTLKESHKASLAYLKELRNEFEKAFSFEEKILYYGKYYDGNAFYLGVPRHAMSFYINAKKGQFIFFDPNFGVVNFASLQDLAKGVSKYTEVVYKKADYIDAISYS